MAWLAAKPLTPDAATAELHRKLKAGRINEIRLRDLLAAGADACAIVDGTQNCSALNLALEHDNNCAALMLVDHLLAHAKVPADASMITRRAIAFGQSEIVEKMLALMLPTRANYCVEEGLLNVAITVRSPDRILDALKAAGADLDTPDKDEYTPLHHAVTFNADKVVHWLLRNGANPNSDSRDSYPPLHLAASCGYMECAKALLKAGASVNRRAYGDRPLHMAVEKNHDAMVGLLLDHGADPELENENGFTAMAVASIYGQSDAQSMLLEYGARITKDLRNFKALDAQYKKACKVWDDWRAEGCDPEALTADHIRQFAVAGMLEQLTKPTFWRGREDQLSRVLNDLPKHLANRLSVTVLDVMHDIAAPTTTITGWDATIDLTPQEVIWKR